MSSSRTLPIEVPLSAFRRALSSLDAKEGLSSAWLITAFCIACLLIILRDPSMLTDAQFYAEDGTCWFGQAYNGGWLHSLTIPEGGYLNTLQRLFGGVALLVPFRWAPLTMTIGGLICQALPVPILLSSRCHRWTSLSLRMAFAAAYIAMPNAHEIHVVCTNSHFHYALAEVLLAFSVPPRTIWGRIFDVMIFLIGGVSGPFVLILLPFLAIFWFVRRQSWSLVQIGFICVGSVAQLYCLRSVHAARFDRALGASWSLFVRLVGGNIYLATLHGSYPYGFTQPFLICLVVFIIGVALCVYCACKSSLEIRLFLVYCYAVLAASLRSPMAWFSSLSPWMELLHGASLRHWFFPVLTFLFAILWCLWFGRPRAIRWFAAALTLLLCQGIARDWSIHRLADLNFPHEAARFESATPGTIVTIPINPPGVSMTLTKK